MMEIVQFYQANEVCEEAVLFVLAAITIVARLCIV